MIERKRVNAAQHIILALVQVYRYTISPAKSFLFGPLGRCRFSPSCSEYALEAVRTRGAAMPGATGRAP